MEMTQLGLFAIIWVAIYFVPKFKYSVNDEIGKWLNKDLPDKDNSEIASIFFVGMIYAFCKSVIVWIAAGALLPYVHAYIPLLINKLG